MTIALGLAVGLAAALFVAPVSAAFAGARAAPAPSPAVVGPQKVLKLTNADAGGITSIYAAPAGAEAWSDDLLGKQTAGAGKTVTLMLKSPPEQCRYDLQVLMNDGKAVQKKDLDLCASDIYQFTR